MTTQEFENQYEKLVKVYPQVFGNDVKRTAVASYIKDLDARWWCALVNRMILSSNPRLDIEDAARGERLARKRVSDTEAMFKLSDKLQEKITDQGLDKALNVIGAQSLLDAITNYKKIKG